MHAVWKSQRITASRGGSAGEPIEVSADRARVQLTAIGEMTVDPQGLVHGGFIFGAADHAAMLAVNDPNVVLGSADVRFLAPVSMAAVVDFDAEVVAVDGARHQVTVEGRVGERVVFSGSFTCFVLERHVLDDSV